jgi:hypothetical protein
MSGDGIGSTAGYIGGIYRPGVSNSAGEFPTSQPIAANPFFEGPTDDCRCLLPIGIRWIKRGRNCHERVPRVPNSDVEWESQTDVAHFHPDVVGDFVDRLSNDVALYVEGIACRLVVVDGVHMGVLQGVEVFIVLQEDLIPRLTDQNRWAQSRIPMDMMVQG